MKFFIVLSVLFFMGNSAPVEEGKKENNGLAALNPFGTKNENNKNQNTQDSGPLGAIGNAIGSVTGQGQNTNNQNSGNPLGGLFGNAIPSGILGNNGNAASKIQMYFGGNAGILVPLDALPAAFMQGILNMATAANGSGGNPIQGIAEGLGDFLSGKQ